MVWWDSGSFALPKTEREQDEDNKESRDEQCSGHGVAVPEIQ